MSRCSICDCSQSADSLYHNSLTTQSSTMIRYVRKFDEFICNDCRQSILDQRIYWKEVDGVSTEFNHFEATALDDLEGDIGEVPTD